jgi:hypothetical protein
MRDAKTLIVLSGMMFSLACGVFEQVVPRHDNPPFVVVLALAGVAFVFAWYRVDADRRGFRRAPLMGVAVVALAIVGMPWYLIRTRGFARGLGASLVFVALLIVASLVREAGALAAANFAT